MGQSLGEQYSDRRYVFEHMCKLWEAQARRQAAQSMLSLHFLPGRSDLTFCFLFCRSVLGTLGQKYDQYLDFAH